ncbi:MAG: DUF3501 domain-containing protein [Hydrogenophilales bacterium CG17_big_fil_post_rev_8_21_14_2_50_63_12]|nr:MAG: DUF3501 domain-containing protein [Hydrogenophilales bacterium CG17_big_fil_post_rev_8_21_14_2_50_63_12]PIX97764.1 MAG: DUF3501 domain-containing protein [Hydrogenophilales bacterium CG_4_10_14_3_um_filter_63_21]
MKKLARDDLYSLERYAEVRPEFRARVIAHKKNRRVPLGARAALYFEDALTVQYQVQEMLRIERIFEARGIQDELDVYNPMIPDGGNWKATFMLEYTDENERRAALAKLIGVEKAVWMRVAGFDPVYPISNEDLDRSSDGKTASVHFMRFELTPAMVAAVNNGAAISAGIDHPNLQATLSPLPAPLRDALAADLG